MDSKRFEHAVDKAIEAIEALGGYPKVYESDSGEGYFVMRVAWYSEDKMPPLPEGGDHG